MTASNLKRLAHEANQRKETWSAFQERHREAIAAVVKRKNETYIARLRAIVEAGNGVHPTTHTPG